jgi:outer membrane immunogenic protein
MAAGSSWAADMPVKAPRAPVEPVYTWTGCYIGANIGGGSARNNYIDPLDVPPTPLGSHRATGIVGGGQVGCDYQSGQWVFGVQGMTMGPVKGSHVVPADVDVIATRSRGSQRSPDAWALRFSRIGWPTKGAARLRDTRPSRTSVLEATARTRSGYVVGGGLEWLFGPKGSIFAEFDYLNFGRRLVTFANLEIPPVPPTFPLSIRTDVQVGLVGINFRFWP